MFSSEDETGVKLIIIIIIIFKGRLYRKGIEKPQFPLIRYLTLVTFQTEDLQAYRGLIFAVHHHCCREQAAAPLAWKSGRTR